MEHIAFDGRRVLSRPGEVDGLIRGWLSRQGWRAPTRVKDGCIYVSNADKANDLTTLLARRWDEVVPQPTVGIYER